MQKHHDIITASNGAQVDISSELFQIICIGRWYQPGSVIHSADSKFLHQTGWGLIAIAGADAAENLIDNLLDDRKISPHFADYLRTKWGRVAIDFREDV
jgi:hypothetical protein